MLKAYDIPYSNYPPGVTDGDSYFTDGDVDSLESEEQYQSRRAKISRDEREHDPACQCNECELPY